jgi:hypothetical protein
MRQDVALFMAVVKHRISPQEEEASQDSVYVVFLDREHDFWSTEKKHT